MRYIDASDNLIDHLSDLSALKDLEVKTLKPIYLNFRSLHVIILINQGFKPNRKRDIHVRKRFGSLARVTKQTLSIDECNRGFK